MTLFKTLILAGTLALGTFGFAKQTSAQFPPCRKCVSQVATAQFPPCRKCVSQAATAQFPPCRKCVS
jgi:hypothetical protein